MTIEELRAKLAELIEKRDGLIDQFEQITRGAVDEQGEARAFTPEEAENRGRLTAQIERIKEDITAREDEVRQAEENSRKQEMQDAVAQMRRELGLSATSSLSGVQVNEHRVYERGNGVSYLKDMAVRSFGPGLGSAWSQACERLARHAQENHYQALEIEKNSERSDAEQYFVRQMVEQTVGRETFGASPSSDRRFGYGETLQLRAISTTSGAGGEFVPPMYLTEEWIAYLRAGRVVANCAHHENLPDGTMSINIPKVTGGTSVAVQNGQNTAVSQTDITTAFVTVPVVTLAGQQTISLQLLERSPIQFDQVIWSDLAKAHAAYTDQQVINGSGSSGQMTGILNTSGINTVTWTQASPTVKGLYGQIATAKVDIDNTLFLPATHQFMTPYVLEWLGQSFDSSNRPLVVPDYNGPFNAVQVAPDAAVAEGAFGSRVSGLNTFKDANIPANLGAGTNQSVVIVSRMQENFLYESPVVTRALPQTLGNQLSVILQLYSYGAFSAARYPTANSVITGTGLASANLTYNS